MQLRRDRQGSWLTPEIMNVLLVGWGRVSSRKVHDMEVFDLSEEDFRALWRRYKPELGAEAARRGLTTIAAEERYDLNPPEWLCESKGP